VVQVAEVQEVVVKGWGRGAGVAGSGAEAWVAAETEAAGQDWESRAAAREEVEVKVVVVWVAVERGLDIKAEGYLEARPAAVVARAAVMHRERSRGDNRSRSCTECCT